MSTYIANIPLLTVQQDYFYRKFKLLNYLDLPFNFVTNGFVAANMMIRDNQGEVVFELSNVNGMIELDNVNGFIILKVSTPQISSIQADTYIYQLQLRDLVGNIFTIMGGEFRVVADQTSFDLLSYQSFPNGVSYNSNASIVVTDLNDNYQVQYCSATNV